MLLVEIEGNAGKSKLRVSSSVIKFRESILAEAKGNKIITSLVLSTHGPSRHSFAQCMCYAGVGRREQVRSHPAITYKTWPSFVSYVFYTHAI